MNFLKSLMEYVDTVLSPHIALGDEKDYNAFKNIFKHTPDDFYKVSSVEISLYFDDKNKIPVLDLSENEDEEDYEMQMEHIYNLCGHKLDHLFKHEIYNIRFTWFSKEVPVAKRFYTRQFYVDDALKLIRNLLTKQPVITEQDIEKYYG